MRMLQFTASLLVMAAVSGCVGGRVASNVTTFHQIQPNTFIGKKLAIVAYPAEKQQSLEFATYKEKLSAQFIQKGMTVTDNTADADWLAFVSYGIDDGKPNKDIVSIPQFGQTGGGTTYHSGSINSGGGYGSYSGTSYTMPTYGITGHSTYTVDSTTYTRNLTIDIVDRASVDRGTPVKLYEGRAISKGSCGSLAGVFDAISAALLKNWPGTSGKAETIEILWDGKC